MNNNRFKFRVWDKNKKQFINPKDYSTNGIRHVDSVGEILLDFEGEIRWANFPCGNGDNSADSVFSPFPDQDRFVIQQFTGLNDKNGKEIYEGDVLKAYRKWEVFEFPNGYRDVFGNLNTPISKGFYETTRLYSVVLDKITSEDDFYYCDTIGWGLKDKGGTVFSLLSELNSFGRLTSDVRYKDVVSEIFVVGNIFENEELLK